MSSRRSFLAAAVGAVLGLLGLSAGRGFSRSERAPEVAERDREGNCLARAYKLAPDGCFYEVPRESLRPGDRMVMLGLDGKRLWVAQSFTVGEGGSRKNRRGVDEVFVEGPPTDLLRVP